MLSGSRACGARYGSDSSNLSINITTQRSLAEGAEFERGYPFGCARNVGRKGLRGGAELIHSLSDKVVHAGPVASYGFGLGLCDGRLRLRGQQAAQQLRPGAAEL